MCSYISVSRVVVNNFFGSLILYQTHRGSGRQTRGSFFKDLRVVQLYNIGPCVMTCSNHLKGCILYLQSSEVLEVYVWWNCLNKIWISLVFGIRKSKYFFLFFIFILSNCQHNAYVLVLRPHYDKTFWSSINLKFLKFWRLLYSTSYLLPKK